MTFSGALTLTDLNDFITPSQACIKPVEQTNKPLQDGNAHAVTEIRIDESGAYYEVNPSFSNTGADSGAKKLEQAQISLNDCLACSGCITSAESVLITLQSHTEVLNVLSDPQDERIPIISIAPQSLASLAVAYSIPLDPSTTPDSHPRINGSTTYVHDDDHDDLTLTPHAVLQRLKHFLTNILGFAYVFDTTFARHLALKEHVSEFLERRRRREQSGLSANVLPRQNGAEAEEDLPLPMLASACPGWICYAEKAHSEMLPFIARTKSPQQVMGTLVKKWIGKKLGRRPNEVYHVAVMPCYDKKLEASRQEFFDEIFQTRDVDCVVTTGELEAMMREVGWDLRSSSPSPLPTSTTTFKRKPSPADFPELALPEMLMHPGTSSGSYLHAIIEHLMTTSTIPLALTVSARTRARARNQPNPNNEVHHRSSTVINAETVDYEEYVLRETPSASPASREKGNGKIIFKGIKCYGFRNLQNVVRKVGREAGVRVGTGAAGRLATGGRPDGGSGGDSGIGTGTGAGRGMRKLRVARKNKPTDENGGEGEDREEESRIDYVEVMACPGGCVNGGGQLRPIKHSNTGKRLTDAEGYERSWETEGVALTPKPTPPPPPTGLDNSAADASTMTNNNMANNAKWGDKEWIKRVEKMYWRKAQQHGDEQGRVEAADQLADEIIEELCSFECENGGGDDSKGSMGALVQREKKRKGLFQTEYRAVESEVVGLAVKW